MLFSSASCQKKGPAPANPAAAQPQDHFLGTWKLNRDKSPLFSPFAYNPIPVYEWIVISGDVSEFTLAFSHESSKPGESERVLVTDMKAPGVGVDIVNSKMLAYRTYVRRTDADSFVQGSGISENTYKVLPDQKTMTVKQFPMIDNGFERQLVYEKVPDTNAEPVPRF